MYLSQKCYFYFYFVLFFNFGKKLFFLKIPRFSKNNTFKILTGVYWLKRRREPRETSAPWFSQAPRCAVLNEETYVFVVEFREFFKNIFKDLSWNFTPWVLLFLLLKGLDQDGVRGETTEMDTARVTKIPTTWWHQCCNVFRTIFLKSVVTEKNDQPHLL